jgi:outer membrane protein assembly factor BamB
MVAVPTALLLLVTTAGVAMYLLIRPGEWVTEASQRYPDPPALSQTVIAELRAAPLIVDHRLRVFATKHDVWAEPLAAPDGVAPFWSYHLFPAQVSGVVATPAHGDTSPRVIVKWSDGALIAIDARTGQVTWRTKVEIHLGGDDWLGGPTGVATVYGDSLLGLFTAQTQDSKPVVISSGERSVDAFEPATGRSLWHLDVPGCMGVDWTGETVFAAILACDEPATVHFFDAGTGREVGTWWPRSTTRSWIITWYSGCAVALSGCSGFVVSDKGGGWWVHRDGTLTAEPDPGWRSATAGEVSVQFAAGWHAVRALSRVDGSQLWYLPFPEGVDDLATDGTDVYAMTRQDRLVRLDPRTGKVKTTVALPAGASDSFHFHATDGYVLIDRSNFDFTDRDADWTLPRDARPVLLIAA